MNTERDFSVIEFSSERFFAYILFVYLGYKKKNPRDNDTDDYVPVRLFEFHYFRIDKLPFFFFFLSFSLKNCR